MPAQKLTFLYSLQHFICHMLKTKSAMAEKPDSACHANGRTQASRKFARAGYRFLKKDPAALDRYSQEMQHYFECNGEMMHNARVRLKHLSDLESFDPHYLEKYNKARILLGLMNVLPASDIKKGFGNDALLWAWINNPGRQSTGSLDGLVDAGMDMGMALKAWLSAAELAGQASYRTVAPLYRLLTGLSGFLPSLGIGKLLSASAKTELSEKHIADYSLEVLISSGNSYGNDRN